VSIIKTTEWEGETVRLVKLAGLARHANFPRGLGRSAYMHRPGRPVVGLVAHTTAGSRKNGLDAPIALAKWIIRPPVYKRDAAGNVVYRTLRSGKKKPKIIGGGRGWPGAPYTFLVPHIPETVDGLLEVYRLWDDEWHTWHTSKATNRDHVAVGFAGSFKTRHAPNFSDRDPHPLALAAGTSLIVDYLLPRYNLTADEIYGHFDHGKPTCPGDTLERWVRETRGEFVEELDESLVDTAPVHVGPLNTWKERQVALDLLGYDLGPAGVDGHFGLRTRRSVESLQANTGLIIDGIWGPRTERAVRVALAGLPS